ncbi:MAG: hypothetical protein HY841_02820 [Bacteroidetes bacterium]|nr:hypothetical protein [Bacteroidota bacterium]
MKQNNKTSNGIKDMFNYKAINGLLENIFFVALLVIAAGALCEYVLKPLWHLLKGYLTMPLP